MGFLGSLIGGLLDGRGDAKMQAYAHLQSMSDQIEVMRRICENSSCSNCKYGTSPTDCEYNEMVDLYNETLNDYAKRKLIKKG